MMSFFDAAGDASSVQVDLWSLLGAVGGVGSLLISAWISTIKIAIANRDKDVERRFDELRGSVKSMDDRLHTEEKATIRQDGDLRLVQSNHTGLSDDIHEIKRTMATKVELQPIAKAVDQILAKMEGRRYTSGGTPQYVNETTSPDKPVR